MSIIYKPEGRAREYSPLALNLYNGCDHGCVYCYNKRRSYFTSTPVPKKELIEQVTEEVKKLQDKKQVLLCFAGDPYCKKEVELQMTRQVLEILLNYKIPTAILTKGGTRCLRDLALFKRFSEGIKVGATLTFISAEHSSYYEPGAALPDERFSVLKQLHDAGIRTWVSLEPVLDIRQSLEIIDITQSYVDEYKVGKLNGYSITKNNPYALNIKPDWGYFLHQAVKKLKSHDKKFYIKKDLRTYDETIGLRDCEKDADHLTVKYYDKAA